MLAAALALAVPTAIPPGKSETTVKIGGTEIPVSLYRPANFRGGRMILVFHGTLRNAEEYRDHAVTLGDRFGALIAAPKFPRETYPGWRYNRGGVVNDEGVVQPRETWTYALIRPLADALRARAGAPKMPWTGIGHSAGGQFVVRMAAFVDTGATALVAANPGSLLFPRTDWNFGYGFGGLTPELASEDAIKRYLAQPLCIYTGTGDNRPDEDLDVSEEANRQGYGRTQRALAAFEYARSLAEKKGWPFGWRLVRAVQVPHDHELMFQHPAVERALFGGWLPR